MLESVKITRRQSEIRQSLAGLVGKEKPTEDETRSMESLDGEYRQNEVRYRASLIAEDGERREARGELETRGEKEFSDLIGKFELRQVALMLDEGRALDGPTLEVVQELRSKGGYRGVPVPWAALALERRAGETVASGTPDPVTTMPIIDRIFPDSVAAKMGAQVVNIDSGEVDYPVATSAVTAGWAATETGAVSGPTAYATTDRPLVPDNALGVQMRLTRKAMKQSGPALEQAVRRDMNGAIGTALDHAVFQGAGSGGEPTGIIAGAAGWGVTTTAIGAVASWAAFRAAVTRFLTANAATGPNMVNLLIRPEVWNDMDSLIDGLAISEWDRLVANIGNVVMSSNALPAPTGSPTATDAILSTVVGGISPIYIGLWGAVDLIRDPYSDAASGALRLTALATADVTISRAAQLQVLTGIE